MDILTEAATGGLRWGRPDGAIVSRASFVAEARSWIGTPFVHQHEMKGVGVDCGGLVRGVSVALGLIPQNYRELVPQELRGYSRQPSGFLGRDLCDIYWRRIPVIDIQPADVVLIAWDKGIPQHGAIVGDYRHGGLSLVHSLGPSGQRGVIEHRMDREWSKRIVAAYQIPGVA